MVSTNDWLHCDQAPHRKGVACIQGLVNMVDVGPHTGVKTCLPWLLRHLIASVYTRCVGMLSCAASLYALGSLY